VVDGSDVVLDDVVVGRSDVVVEVGSVVEVVVEVVEVEVTVLDEVELVAIVELVGALVVVVEAEAHCPSALQISPPGQVPVPQVPPRPQPSGPHVLFAQFGTQHSFSGLHVALVGQQTPLQQRLAQSEFGVPPSTTDV
jgi:hypothetical protein